MTPPAPARTPAAPSARGSSLTRRVACLLALAMPAAFAASAAPAPAEEPAPPPAVKVVDGLVLPKRPVADAIADAVQLLRKADGGYRPGRIDGDVAGYFWNAHLKSDGTRTDRRQLSFPARQHAYFIRTFLHYYAYTGEREWQLRARDLADWNIAHSTPPDCAYPNLPYSAYQDGKPTGSADRNSIETDKPAFLGSAYLLVHENTGDARYLDAARRIAETLARHQRDDGSWPFRVIPGDGSVYQEFGGAPVFFVEFFERLQRHDPKPEWRRAMEGAVRCLIARNVEQGQWGTYHEDIRPHDGTHLSAEPMSFTAAWLFARAGQHPEYAAMGRRVLGQMEGALVHTKGHGAAPAPAVAEQATFMHIMPGHTARYCWALSNLYLHTRDEDARRRALSGINAVTYMQSDVGLWRTFFFDVKRKTAKSNRPPDSDWYSQHLYTVCHLLESQRAFPELVPAGQSHILAGTTAVRDVSYAADSVRYATIVPSRDAVVLAFEPREVRAGGAALRRLPKGSAPADGEAGWTWDAAARLATICHAAGEVRIAR